MSYTCVTYQEYADWAKDIENVSSIETDPKKLVDLSLEMQWLKYTNRNFIKEYMAEKALETINNELMKPDPNPDIILENETVLGWCKQYRHEPAPLELGPPAMPPPPPYRALYTPCVSAMDTDH